MTDNTPDWYEILQVSPHADTDTILRVYRHLAKRFHPDNGESGNAELFNQLSQAFRILSDPEERARYDVKYERSREHRWRIFDQESARNDVEGDRRVRAALLNLLYTARRNDPDRPGLGTVHIERLLGCPEEHLKFHVWYLKENGWIQRLENGQLAITAAGVDLVLDGGGPRRNGVRELPPGDAARSPDGAGRNHTDLKSDPNGSGGSNGNGGY